MIRVLTILAAVVALAVSPAPASAVSDGTSNTRLAAFPPPTSPPTPPGVLPLSELPSTRTGAYAPDQVERAAAVHAIGRIGRRLTVRE